MNQQATHTLRRLFASLPSFPPSDPRYRLAWRKFKKDYLAIERPKRASYLASLKKQVELLKSAQTT